MTVVYGRGEAAGRRARGRRPRDRARRARWRCWGRSGSGQDHAAARARRTGRAQRRDGALEGRAAVLPRRGRARARPGAGGIAYVFQGVEPAPAPDRVGERRLRGLRASRACGAASRPRSRGAAARSSGLRAQGRLPCRPSSRAASPARRHRPGARAAARAAALRRAHRPPRLGHRRARARPDRGASRRARLRARHRHARRRRRRARRADVELADGRVVRGGRA